MADDEDDFMSDAWLEQAKEFDRQQRTGHHTTKASSSTRKRKEPAPPRPVAVLEKEKREQGLLTPIAETNIGTFDAPVLF